MTDDILTWVLMFVGILGFELAGRKIWWAWYVNIANQILWLAFALITGYWGFVVGTVFYTYQFSRNAYKWTKEHFDKNREVPTKDERAIQKGFLFHCGHISDRYQYACVHLGGHEGRHGYGGVFWHDHEGYYSDKFKGRVID